MAKCEKLKKGKTEKKMGKNNNNGIFSKATSRVYTHNPTTNVITNYKNSPTTPQTEN